MKKTVLIIIVIAAILLIFLMLGGQSRRHFDWGISHDQTKGGTEPYDLQLIDSLLARSLPNGYDVRTITPPRVDRNGCDELFDIDYYVLDEIDRMPKDTSLLVIHTYDWIPEDYHEEKEENVSEVLPLINLAKHAAAGGKSLFVMPISQYRNTGYNTLKHNLGYSNSYDLDYRDIDYSKHSPYSGDWLRYIPDEDVKVLDLTDDTLMILNERYLHSDILYNIRSNDSYYYNVEIRPILRDMSLRGSLYAIDVHFIDSGGHIYITTLSSYFCNLGLMLPNGDKVIEQLMSKIDDRPVVRMQYPLITYQEIEDKRNEKESVLKVIWEDKALTLALGLIMLFALAILVRGMMRRHPVTTGYDVLDHTDAIAVREHHLHRSPLLHFLYQCSWLYRGTVNYDDLFKVNFRRLSRTVKRVTGVELKTADDDAIRVAAQTFAKMQGRDMEEVIDELKWMRDANIHDDIIVNEKQYRYSQQVVERYPFK